MSVRLSFIFYSLGFLANCAYANSSPVVPNLNSYLGRPEASCPDPDLSAGKDEDRQKQILTLIQEVQNFCQAPQQLDRQYLKKVDEISAKYSTLLGPAFQKSGDLESWARQTISDKDQEKLNKILNNPTEKKVFLDNFFQTWELKAKDPFSVKYNSANETVFIDPSKKRKLIRSDEYLAEYAKISSECVNIVLASTPGDPKVIEDAKKHLVEYAGENIQVEFKSPAEKEFTLSNWDLPSTNPDLGVINSMRGPDNKSIFIYNSATWRSNPQIAYRELGFQLALFKEKIDNSGEFNPKIEERALGFQIYSALQDQDFKTKTAAKSSISDLEKILSSNVQAICTNPNKPSAEVVATTLLQAIKTVSKKTNEPVDEILARLTAGEVK